MKTYRCVVRSATLAPKSEITLHVTAPDCRTAASAAVRQTRADETAWVEVWDQEELVLMRRQSNLHPLQAAIQMARTELGS